jgi:tetratricopeptide (TPR) repeat protein
MCARISRSDGGEAIRLKPDFAWAFEGRGGAYSDLKQYDKAIDDYNEAIHLDPNLAITFMGRGVSY